MKEKKFNPSTMTRISQSEVMAIFYKLWGGDVTTEDGEKLDRLQIKARAAGMGQGESHKLNVEIASSAMPAPESNKL